MSTLKKLHTYQIKVYMQNSAKYISLRWHCPNQVVGLSTQLTLSLLLQAPLLYLFQLYYATVKKQL